MAQYTYRITIGDADYEIESAQELTDVQAYQAAKAQVDAEPPQPSLADKRASRDANIAAQAPVVDQAADVGAAMRRGILDPIREGAPLTFGKRILRTPKTLYEGAKAVYNDPLGTVASLPGAMLDQARTAGGAIEIMRNPLGVLLDPMSPATQPTETLRQTASDPHRLAQEAGDLVGPAVLGRVLPVTPAAALTATKTAARGAGRVLESTGKTAAWPLRVAGIHNVLGSGAGRKSLGQLPIGAALVAAPELVERAGTALRRWGTAPGAASTSPAAQLLSIEAGLNGAPSASFLTQARKTVTGLQDDLARRIEAAKLPEDLADLLTEQKRLTNISSRLRGTTKSATEPLVAFKSELERSLSQRLEKAGAPAQKGLESLDEAIAQERQAATTKRRAAHSLEGQATKAEQAADRQWYEQQQKATATREASDAASLNAQARYRREVEIARDLADREEAARQAAAAADDGLGGAGGPEGGPRTPGGPSSYEGLSAVEVAGLRRANVAEDAIARTAATRRGQTPTTTPDTASAPRTMLSTEPIRAAERPPRTAPTIEVLDDTSTGPNASGESMASAEALNRTASMQALGKQYVVYDRAGRMRRLIGPEAVDYRVRPGERYGVMGPEGFELLDRGAGASTAPVNPSTTASKGASALDDALDRRVQNIVDERAPKNRQAAEHAIPPSKSSGAQGVGSQRLKADPSLTRNDLSALEAWTIAERAKRHLSYIEKGRLAKAERLLKRLMDGELND
ncbi:MAG: hypothetical protein ABMA15_17460 [Vicinamibacterales bacterium]